MSTTQNQTRTVRTKICAIHTCKYSLGTRNGVQMFTVPTEESRMREWCRSAGISDDKTLRGFVCIEHFTRNDLIGNKNIRLKTGAIPTIFEKVTDKDAASLDFNVNIIQKKNSQYNNFECSDSQHKYDELVKECVSMRADHDIQIANMECKIKFLEEKTKEQSTELKLLRAAKAYGKKKNEELKSSEKDLLKKVELMGESVDAWEVVYGSFH